MSRNFTPERTWAEKDGRSPSNAFCFVGKDSGQDQNSCTMRKRLKLSGKYAPEEFRSSIGRKRLLGCARRFRPTYAVSILGHPSIACAVFEGKCAAAAPTSATSLPKRIFPEKCRRPVLALCDENVTRKPEAGTQLPHLIEGKLSLPSEEHRDRAF